jgi:hypothetical protein
MKSAGNKNIFEEVVVKNEVVRICLNSELQSTIRLNVMWEKREMTNSICGLIFCGRNALCNQSSPGLRPRVLRNTVRAIENVSRQFKMSPKS